MLLFDSCIEYLAELDALKQRQLLIQFHIQDLRLTIKSSHLEPALLVKIYRVLHSFVPPERFIDCHDRWPQGVYGDTP